MARRRGRRRRRFTKRARAAAMRNLRKARAARRRRRRRGGSKRRRRHGRRHYSRRRRHGRRSRSRRRRGRRHGGGGVRHGAVYERSYAKLIARGKSAAQAAKIAARATRMRAGSVRRHFENEAAKAKTSAQLSNVFAGFGAAGHLAHQAKGA